jgi:antitoxin component of MazEF toxin-antitoxin module
MTVESGRLILVPIDSDIPTLQELLEQITDDNLHTEVGTEHPVGDEAW